MSRAISRINGPKADIFDRIAALFCQTPYSPGDLNANLRDIEAIDLEYAEIPSRIKIRLCDETIFVIQIIEELC